MNLKALQVMQHQYRAMIGSKLGQYPYNLICGFKAFDGAIYGAIVRNVIGQPCWSRFFQGRFSQQIDALVV